MVAALSTFVSMMPLAGGAIPPIMVLILCVVAGIGTVLLLPGNREMSLRRIGGVILLAALLIFAAVLTRQAAAGSAGEIYFWLFSLIAIVSAIKVITHVKPVYSALYFVLTVVASAGLFVLLWAEFMAAALILIYAGAILVTYVFVIMLAQQAQSPQTSPDQAADYDRTSRTPVVASAIGFTLMGVLLFLIFDKADGFAPQPAPAATAFDVRELGNYLFKEQLVALELAGLILTLAMVGAVVVARRKVAPAELAPPELVPIGTDDNPHDIPVYGTENLKAKEYPER